MRCSWLHSAPECRRLPGVAPAAPLDTSLSCSWLPSATRKAPAAHQDFAFVLVVAVDNRGGACGAWTSLWCSWLPSATGEAPAAPGRRFHARVCLRQPRRRLRRLDVAFMLVFAFGNRGGACGAWTSLSCSCLPSATEEAPAAPGRRFRSRVCLRQPGKRLRRPHAAFVLLVAFGNRIGAPGSRVCARGCL